MPTVTGATYFPTALNFWWPKLLRILTLLPRLEVGEIFFPQRTASSFGIVGLFPDFIDDL